MSTPTRIAIFLCCYPLLDATRQRRLHQFRKDKLPSWRPSLKVGQHSRPNLVKLALIITG
jgi:hypothetical protein